MRIIRHNFEDIVIMKQSVEQYSELMNQARAFSLELGLAPDNRSSNLKTPSREDLVSYLNKHTRGPDFLAHNCMLTGSFPPLFEELGFQGGEVTIGYMRYCNNDEFFTTREKLAEELASPGILTVQCHVWLSFPDGSIFDPTLLASFEKDKGTNLVHEPINKYVIYDVAGIPSIKNDMEYMPLVVGADYLYRTKILVKPNPEYNDFGKMAADNAYTEALLKGHTLSLTQAIEHYRENEPDHADAIIIGLLNRFDEYEFMGHITKEVVGNPGETYFTATEAALKMAKADMEDTTA